jgi:putative hydrolase of the HAD superfamily
LKAQKSGNSEVKNIIFDFGGVIINIDHQRVEQAFYDLGMTNFKEMFNKATQSELFQKLEIGKIKPDQFRRSIRELTGLQIDDEKFDETWNKIIGDYPPEHIELLKKLRSSYNLYLLSNTNQIHYDFYIGNFRHGFGFEFSELFDGLYWSFKIGKRKPDSVAYLHVIDHNNLAIKETLFIDDSIQNIEAANKLGLQTLFLKPGDEITNHFSGGLLI